MTGFCNTGVSAIDPLTFSAVPLAAAAALIAE